MRSAGLVGVVLALGAAYFVYTTRLSQPAMSGAASPREQIDVVGIKAALLEIGQAERIYVNAHGAYGTLDELRADGAPDLGTDRRGYVFRVEPRGVQGFQATAAPSDPARSDWPTLTIDETMQVASR